MKSVFPTLLAHESVEDKIARLHDGIIDLPAITVVICLRNRALLYVSPQGQELFGLTLDEFKDLGNLYRHQLLNKDDEQDYLPKFQRLLDPTDSTNLITYFLRLHTGNHDWRWYLGSSRIWWFDEKKEPLYLLCSFMEVDPGHKIIAKAQRLMEENIFLEEINPLIKLVTPREREILKLVVSGYSSKRIAQHLGITELTAKTHRKNLKRKLKVQHMFELSRFAEALERL